MDDYRTYSFAEALVAPEHIICSVQLRPFALGHWILLEKYASPLLSPEVYPEAISDDPAKNYEHCIRHILLFLLVCAHSYEDNMRLIDEVDFFNETKTVFENGILESIKHTKYWNIYSVISKIKEYLNFYIGSDAMPEFVENNAPSPPTGSDWKSNIYAVLKNEYGYSQTEIMNMNMRRIYQEWVTYAAKSGAIKLKTRQEIDSQRQAAEYVDKIRKGEIKMEDINASK